MKKVEFFGYKQTQNINSLSFIVTIYKQILQKRKDEIVNFC